MRKRFFIIGGVIVVLVVIIGLTLATSGKKSDEVDVYKVERGDVSPTVTADGLIAARDMVNISSQVMGEITDLPFKEGDKVKKGDVLVQINPDTYQRDVASANASLTSAKVAMNQAGVTMQQRGRDWERAKDLFAKGIYSTQQRDDARLAFTQAKLSADSAKAQVAQALAYYQKAQDNLAKCTIRSPLDGVVTVVNAKVGETAVMGTMNFAGTVILAVSDLSQIITEVMVDEVDLPRLSLGQPAEVTVDALGGRKYEGKVMEIGASAQASQSGTQSNIRQFKVKVALTAPDTDLKPGITTRVKLIAKKQAKVLKVPIGCIRTEEKEGNQIFFVLTVKNGKVEKKVITVGLSDDLDTEVKSGLKEGEEVITGPYRLLRTLRKGDTAAIRHKKKGDKDDSKGKVHVKAD